MSNSLNNNDDRIITMEDIEQKLNSIYEEHKSRYSGDFEYNNFGTLIKYHGHDEYVVIPDRFTSVGHDAFEGNEDLTHIVIPKSVKTIEQFAFANCTNLLRIDISDNIIDIAGHAFSNTAWFNAQPDGLIYIGKILYENKGNTLTSAKIKDGTISIREFAFYGNDRLLNIVFPNTLETIGHSAFYECTNLKSIIIPNNIKYINTSSVFNNCSNLECITFMSSETELLSSRLDVSFYGCPNIKICAPLNSNAHNFAKEKNIPFIEEENSKKLRLERERLIKEKVENERRLQEQKNQQLKLKRRNLNCCQHCGGEFKGIFIKTCKLCGKKKDY